MASERQYWVRNEQGRTWGPYELDALERLRGIFSERWQVALDGRAFKPAGEFPELAELAAAPRRAAPPPIPAPVKSEGAAPDEFEVRKAARAAARAAVEHARVVKAGGSAPEPPPGEPPRAEATKSDPSMAAARPPEPPAPGQAPSAPAPATTPASGSAIITPPALEALTVPEEGDLEAFPPLRLYALAALSSASGWLQLVGPTGSMLQLSFRRGSPEHLESDDPELSLLAFLRKRGTVTAPQAQAAVAHAQKTGVDLVTALFQLQLIPPADAHRLLNEQMLSLLDRALMMWRGRFSFERDAPPPPGAFPLGQRWTLLAESIRRLDAKPLRARLGARLNAPVLRSGGLSLGRVEELALTAHEARLYAAIDGVRTGEELLRDSQDPSATLRLLYLLSELGHLAFASSGAPEPRASQAGAAAPGPVAKEAPRPASNPPPRPASSPPPARAAEPPPAPPPSDPPKPAAVPARPPSAPAAARPPPPGVARTLPSMPTARPAPPRAPSPASVPIARPPAPGAAPRPASSPFNTAAGAPATTFVSSPPGETPAAMEARLTAVLARIEPADHFTALGLDRKATSADVKKAFFQLARELHPDTVQDGNVPLRDLKQRLFARVNEAAQVLQDEKRRKEHEDDLDGKGSVDVARIFAAEEAFQRGEIMIKARKIAEGLALIEEAIELNADEGEFYAWRGWARFVLSKDRKAQHPLSAADCRKALAMIEKCLPAWLFLGNMAKAMGDQHEAERSFRKVIELDPKHVEALRELRAMGKKIDK